MIDYATFCRIKSLRAEQKLGVSQITTELGLDRRTVVNALKRKNYQPRQRGSRSSVLDPYKDFLKSELKRHDYSARQLYQRL